MFIPKLIINLEKNSKDGFSESLEYDLRVILLISWGHPSAHFAKLNDMVQCWNFDRLLYYISLGTF